MVAFAASSKNSAKKQEDAAGIYARVKHFKLADFRTVVARAMCSSPKLFSRENVPFYTTRQNIQPSTQ